ncbi:unnamed protein product [Absidia cylindrospora]
MDSSEQVPIANLPPSAQLARLHAQAKSESATVVEDPNVPSQNDPVLVENSMFAEPLIAGDYPTPIGQQPLKKSTTTPAMPTKKDTNLDLNSESAFPTLSSGAPRPPVIASGWSSAASRIKSRPAGNQQQQQQQQKRAPASGSVPLVRPLPMSWKSLLIGKLSINLINPWASRVLPM